MVKLLSGCSISTRQLLIYFVSLLLTVSSTFANDNMGTSDTHNKRLVYLVSDIRIPFWATLARGIQNTALSKGYEVDIYSAENSARQELKLMVKAIHNKVDGIILSPTTSSAATTILKLAGQAHIPVVIADIGADSGEYVSYISSDNKTGAYQIGKLLVSEMQQREWENGSVGIIAIPQKRANGQARTAGFMQALNESNIKGADIKQQVSFSYQETYQFTKTFIESYPDLRAIWLQGSNLYYAALDAITDANKQDELLLICFDAEPAFLDLIPQGVLVGAAMQQPFLMGQESATVMDNYLQGKVVDKQIQLPVLAISSDNIAEQLTTIKRNVLGLEP